MEKSATIKRDTVFADYRRSITGTIADKNTLSKMLTCQSNTEDRAKCIFNALRWIWSIDEMDARCGGDAIRSGALLRLVCSCW